MQAKALVGDVMSSNVLSVEMSTTFKEIARRLREARVSAFPVLDDGGAVTGVVSESDLLAKEALGSSQAGAARIAPDLVGRKDLKKASAITAADLMTHPAITVAPEQTVEQAARMMYTYRIKRLPVVDSAHQLRGIITRTDVLAVYDRPDQEIHREISNDVILGQFVIDPDMFTVIVKDGIVTLHGSPETVSLAHQITDQIRHVQGVVAVRDRLCYPPR
jgi:CBS domain-containing protein